MTKGDRGRNHRPWSSGFKGVVKSTRPRVSDSGLRAGTLVNFKELKVSLSRACTAQGYRFNTEGRRG